MIDINISKVTKTYGFNNILDNISLEINKGDIVSIVGDNGAGKSTLLKIIAKEETVTSGTVAIRSGATIGLLHQIPDVEENVKVLDILYRSVKEILDIEDKLKRYENKMQEVTGKELDKILNSYSNLQDKYINIGGYEVSEKIGRIVTGFKIENLLDSNFNILSGGEKTIVSLAALMIKSPDILLLDEPTNHLDIDTLEWLEGYLKAYKGTIVIVSHDRYFLDKVSTRTILIENGSAEIFYGNYSYYLEENEKRVMLEFKNYNNQQKQISAMKASIKKLQDWGRIGDNERFFKRAKCMQARLDKMEKLNKPLIKKELPINFDMNIRSGKEVIIVKDLNISYDKVLFNNANMLIRFGEHVCLIGNNGTGKSTLINALLNGNDSIKLGTNLNIGYIPQEIHFEDENKSVLEIAREDYVGDEQHLRSSLYKFMFYGENIQKKVGKISGGEKVRLKLFCLIQKKANLLILDEPTNHIDIATREVLESALNDYNGTVLFISHDRYFINKVAEKIVAIEDTKLVEYLGNYDYYKNTVKNCSILL